MLNYIWLGLIGLAVLIGGFRGEIGAVGTAAIDSANTAVTLALGLIAVMTLWLGLMRLADKAGLVNRLGLALKPVMTWLFPEVPPEHPAMGAIILNVAANILGLNNAATPLGLRAMNELESLNRRPGVATNAMCMLLAINTSSITLIPVTVIALLALAHGKNPTIIIGSSLVATAIAHAAAIGTCKLLERSRFYRLPPPAPENLPETPLEEIDLKDPATGAGRRIEEEAVRTDTELPWAPYAGFILAGVGGLFFAMLLVTAFPEIMGTGTSGAPFAAFWSRMEAAGSFLAGEPGTALRVFALRLVNSLSVLAIPWLILFFPLYASLRRIPVYEEFVEGGKEGFQVIIRILPYIVGMLVAIGMFRAAGGMDLITELVRPVTNLFGFPPELVPLALIRPFSGAASLPLLKDIVDHFGPDSFLSLTAGTMYGCSETTFYVIAIYFGSVGIRKTRHAIPAGIVADIVGPIASVVVCRMMFG
jgi:spore maturation protein SpmA